MAQVGDKDTWDWMLKLYIGETNAQVGQMRISKSILGKFLNIEYLKGKDEADAGSCKH